MLSDLLFLSLGVALGACTMKMVVDYKDKHVSAERRKTEHYRALAEKQGLHLAQYTNAPHWPVATPQTDDAAPLPLDLFTQEDQEALHNGRRVVRMVKGGTR